MTFDRQMRLHYRLLMVQHILLNQADDKAFIDWAIGDLRLFYEPEHQIIQALERRAKALGQ